MFAYINKIGTKVRYIFARDTSFFFECARLQKLAKK